MEKTFGLLYNFSAWVVCGRKVTGLGSTTLGTDGLKKNLWLEGSPLGDSALDLLI